METIVKIDKKAKYIVLYDDGSYNIFNGEELLVSINKSIEDQTTDQIFKLGEEYKIETKLVKVNNNQTK